MLAEWLTKVGKYPVERQYSPHSGVRVSLTAPPKGVLHTIEGSLESGMSVFRKHYAPHFAIGRVSRVNGGPVRIFQLMPLGYMASTLENPAGGVETNKLVRVQIEIAGFSQHVPWLPEPAVTDALATLLAELQSVQGIPLSHPVVSRDVKRWLTSAGWLGHGDVPEQLQGHWDPGALRWEELLSRARKIAHPPSAPIRIPIKQAPRWKKTPVIKIVADGKRVNARQHVGNPALLPRIGRLIRRFKKVVITREK